MKKKIFAVMFACVLFCANTAAVFATEVQDLPETAEEGAAEEGTEEGETQSGIVIPDASGYVETSTIDLSLHVETSGDFTAVYAYENPFRGKDTSRGVVLEFYAKPTWEVHELGAIFAIVGSGDYDGKLYFSPGSYLGFNSGNFGGYYDANLFNYTIVTDYIKDGALIRIELTPDGFAVYADDELCYDQTILDNPEAGAGDFTSSSDFSPVLEWLAGAEALYFGSGSWWNAVGSNEANIDLSQVSFRLQDGTVVMDKLMVDKELIESLGGQIVQEGEIEENTQGQIELADVEVELFDINSVEYDGVSVLPAMVGIVIAVAVLAVVIVVVVTRKRIYDEI